MKVLLITLLVTASTSTPFAQESKEYNGVKAIQELYSGWLIVRLPGYEKKLSTIDSLLDITDLSEKALRDLERQRTNTLEEREFIYKWYPVMFDSAYTFSKVAFIYTHETEEFQSGQLTARRSSGEPIPSIHDDVYFFATLQGVRSDPFVFTSRDHRTLAYPFPNRIGLSGFIFPDLIGPPVPDWIKTLEEKHTPVFRVYRHVYRINRKLRAFYERG